MTSNARILGLAQASMAGSFTLAGGNTLSLLFDSMVVGWNNGNPDPKRMPEVSFAIVASPEARGLPIKFEMRGFAQPPVSGIVRVKVGDRSYEALAVEEGYYAVVEANLDQSAETTAIIVTLDLPAPTDQSAAQLALDSIDLTLDPDAQG